MSSFTNENKKATDIDPDLSDDEEEEQKNEEEQPKEEDTSLANSDVTTKYQEAAKIAQSTLVEVIALCVAGAKVVDICRAGDSLIEQKSSLIFRNKSKKSHIEKGIAFPVCLSVNECVCHNSPLTSDDTAVLVDGDMVKIDVGCHVDGYIAVVAHTVVVGVTTVTSGDIPPAPLEGSTADVMNAAYAAAEVALKLIKPNNTNKMVSEAIQKVAVSYGVNLISGTVMHQMKRYVIDGNKVIILREEPDQKVEECTFEQFEVYAVDVAMTSGDGKPREQDTRTTVFKRAVDKTYNLRMKGSRAFYSEVAKRFPTLPFTLRSFSDERSAKMGVRECVSHELLLPYPVLYERAGDKIAHVKFTILLLQGGTSKITGLPLPEGVFISAPEKQLPEDILAILNSQNKKKKKKKSKKSGNSAGAGAAAEEEGEDA